MPAIPSSIIEPVWDQFEALLPPHPDAHPLGCHRPRIPDRVVFDKLVQVLVVGCAYWRIADRDCSASTLRRRRDAWITAGVMEHLATIVEAAYDTLIGLALEDLAVDGCITEAPCGGELAGRSPVDRGKQGLKRSTLVEAEGIPLGTVVAPAARHDSPLLEPTLDLLDRFTPFPEPPTVHLDRGDDSAVTRERLAQRELVGEISPRGKPAPVAATGRWVIERTHAWTNAHKKLVWCTERRLVVIEFWLTCSAVRITVGRLVREGWSRYRWDERPAASREEGPIGASSNPRSWRPSAYPPGNGPNVLSWVWRRLQPQPEAPTLAPSFGSGEGETPEDVFYDAAARFPDVQTTTNIALDSKAATTLSVGSTVLPVSFGLLNLGPREIPLWAQIFLIAAVAAYVMLLVLIWRASLIRAMDYRPDLLTMERYSQEYEGTVLRRWVAREYRISTEANTENLDHKARWVGAANIALYTESLLLSIAAILTLL